MAQVFLKKNSGQILGPIESNQLKAMVAAGSLVQNDSLAKTKQGPWKTAASIKGLFEGNIETKQTVEVSRDDKMPETVPDQSLEIGEGSIKVLRFAERWNSECYYVQPTSIPVVLSKSSIDSVHGAKYFIYDLSTLEKKILLGLLGAVVLPMSLVFMVSFSIFLGFANSGSLTENGVIDELLDNTFLLGALIVLWLSLVIALVGFTAYLGSKRQFHYLVKINTKGKHILVPYRTEQEAKATVDKIQDVFLNE